MKLIQNMNPLKTRVELDDMDKRHLRDRIHIEELEELLGDAALHSGKDEKYFDMDRVRNAVSWSSWCGDKAKIITKIDQMYLLAIEELEDGIHCGDCTSVAASCMKCWAEDLIGINTIKGLDKKQAYLLDSYFRTNASLEAVICALDQYEPKATWEGWEAHAPKWKADVTRTTDWLRNYRDKHFGDKQ